MTPASTTTTLPYDISTTASGLDDTSPHNASLYLNNTNLDNNSNLYNTATVAPQKPNNKNGGKTKRRKKNEGPTPASILRAIERSLHEETTAPVPLPRGSKRDEFKDTGCMKRLRRRGVVRRLAPKDDTLLRNNFTSYKEANSGYQRGHLAREPCEQW
jgi:hypothetical protein